MPSTFLSAHAYERVSREGDEKRRLNMSEQEVLRILDNDLAVPVGRDPKDKHRVHRLFYSVADDACFVALQDERNGEVVTILPIAGHNRFVLSTDALVMAKRLILPQSVPEPSRYVAGPNTRCFLCVEVVDAREKTKFGTSDVFRVLDGTALDELFNDEYLQRKAIERIKYMSRRLRPGERVSRVRVHFVSSGDVSDYMWFWIDQILKSHT